MRLFPLFASNLIEDRFDDENILLSIKEIFNNTEFENYDDDQRSNNSGSLSFSIINDYPEIKNKILYYFEKYNELLFHYPCRFKISTSWFTKTSKGGFSQFHSHRNSFYSGVLYFGEYSNDYGPIEFTSPVADLFSNYVIPKKYNVYNCEVWKVYPTKGTILFFPSYLKHRIGEHNSNEERCSLAFNIVPIGEYGIEDSYYNTEWF